MADYIDRYDALNAINDAISHNPLYEDGVDEALEMIMQIPAADVVERKTGEWGYRWKVHGDGRRPTELFPCSECEFENTVVTNYCPNCGARMVTQNEERTL